MICSIQTHRREIVRVQACGGEKCEDLEEAAECAEEERKFKQEIIKRCSTVSIVNVVHIQLRTKCEVPAVSNGRCAWRALDAAKTVTRVP